jgi:orotate phosphoribosyltransferase-like protein
MTIEKAKKLRAEGMSYRKIGKELAISEGWLGNG